MKASEPGIESPFDGPGPDARFRADASSAAATSVARKAAWIAAMAVLCAIFGFNLVFFPPLLLFGALGGLAAVSIIVARPFIGLLVYTCIIFIRPAETYPVLAVLRVERLVGLVTLTAMAFEMFRRDGRISMDWSGLTRLLLLFTALMALGVPTSYWPGNTVEMIVEFLKILAFYLMIVQLIDTRQRFLAFTAVYLLLTLHLAVSALSAYLSGNFMFAQGIQRAVTQTGQGADPNGLAANLGTAVPLALLWMRSTPRFWLKAALLGGIGLALYVMSLTGARGATLGFLAALFVLWTLSRRKALYGFVAVASLTLAFLALPEEYQERYASITSQELDESSQLRLQTWRAGLEMILDRPLLGVGVGSFAIANHAAYSGLSLQAHNLYVQVPAEVGLLGAVVYFTFLFTLVRLNRRTARILARERSGWISERGILDGIFASLVLLLVFSLFGHTMMRFSWFLFGGMSLALYRLHLDLPPDAPHSGDGEETA